MSVRNLQLNITNKHINCKAPIKFQVMGVKFPNVATYCNQDEKLQLRNEVCNNPPRHFKQPVVQNQWLAEVLTYFKTGLQKIEEDLMDLFQNKSFDPTRFAHKMQEVQ